MIQEAAGQEANIIFGTVIDDSLVDEIRVTVIATGFNLTEGSRAEVIEREPVVVPAPEPVGVEVPAYLRKQRPETPGEPDSGEQLPLEGLEYPAFLRRRTG